MIVVDLQTTGWDERRDRIVSIGAVDFQNPQREFQAECRLGPGTRISAEAQNAFKFELDSLRESSRLSVNDGVKRFFDWSEQCSLSTLAGQNPWFDAAFLREASSRYRLPWPFGYRYVDLHSIYLARLLRLGANLPVENRLDALGLREILKGLGIPYSGRSHAALANARLEAEAFSRLIYGRALFKKYEKRAIPASFTEIHRPE